MILNRTEFINILKAIRPGIGDSKVEDAISHFRFGKNFISSNNNNIFIVHPFEENDFNCFVPFNECFDLLNKLSDKEVSIFLIKNKLEITTKDTNIKLTTINKSEEEFPEVPKKWRKLPDNFLDGCFMCMFSASKDNNMSFLNCLSFEGDDIISSDDLRISKFKLNSKVKSFLIPVKTIVELIKFKVIKYSIEDSGVVFKTKDKVLFFARTINDTYPDCEEQFKFNGKEFIFPEEIKQAVKLTETMSEGESDIEKKINITIKSNKIYVHGKNEVGEVKKKLKMPILLLLLSPLGMQFRD